MANIFWIAFGAGLLVIGRSCRADGHRGMARGVCTVGLLALGVGFIL